jgi:hypothetical protein
MNIKVKNWLQLTSDEKMRLLDIASSMTYLTMIQNGKAVA